MINPSDYLTLLSMMTAEEKSTYFADVTQWTEETYPRLLAHIDAWSESEVKDFETGLLLSSALIQARSFIPNAHQFTTDKALQKLSRFMESIRRHDKGPKDIINAREGLVVKKYRHAAVTPIAKVDNNGEAVETNPEITHAHVIEQVSAQFGDRRPTHYDSWLHLMSPGLRDKITNLQSMYLELAAAREMAEKLDDKATASKADKAAANQRVIYWDDQIRLVHQAADAEWHAITTATYTPASEGAAPSAVPGDTSPVNTPSEHAVVGEPAAAEGAEPAPKKRRGRKPKTLNS